MATSSPLPPYVNAAGFPWTACLSGNFRTIMTLQGFQRRPNVEHASQVELGASMRLRGRCCWIWSHMEVKEDIAHFLSLPLPPSLAPVHSLIVVILFLPLTGAVVKVVF